MLGDYHAQEPGYDDIEKAVIDPGKCEATAGLTFACLSRAKRLVDLLVEPMPVDRLSKLGDKPTLKI